MDNKKLNLAKKPLIRIGKQTQLLNRKGKKIQKRKLKPHSYSIYIYRVLKELKPLHSITEKAMSIMNTFVNDMYRRIAKDASNLVINANRKVLSVDDIKAAVKLNFKGELGTYANGEGERALRTLRQST